MSFSFASLERRVAALEANRGASLRFGTITEVNPEEGSARVQLPDGGNMVSWPLRVLGRRSVKDKPQCLPDLGDPVACLFSGQGLETGVVLGAHYSKKVPAPGKPPTQDYMVYEDGTELWYDREAHKLVARVRGDVDVAAEGQITLTAKKELRVESAQRLVLRAPDIALEGNLSQQGLSGGSAHSVLNGSYTVRNGSISVPDNDVTAGSVSLRMHEHTHVMGGSGVSGPPTGG